MIAYLFWHWPADPVDRSEYEARQAAFHAALRSIRPEGFLESWRFHVEGAFWLPERRGYEDWYLVEGSFALDPLNEAAVSARTAEAHRGAAEHAAGVGGLYRLARGVPGAPGAPAAKVSWTAKPRGEKYPDFYDRFPADAVVWRRMMVLGPAPEFLLEGEPPAGLEAQRVERRRLT